MLRLPSSSRFLRPFSEVRTPKFEMQGVLGSITDYTPDFERKFVLSKGPLGLLLTANGGLQRKKLQIA